jgi:hypothetical protein
MPAKIHKVVLLVEVETENGVPLEPGDIGELIDVKDSGYIVEFEFDSENPPGSIYDTACLCAGSFAIIV